MPPLNEWIRAKKDSAVEILADEVTDRTFGLNVELADEICSQQTSRAEKCLLLEYSQLSRILPPDGMYLLPVRECILRWDGVFFIQEGPFEGSIIRFVVKIPENYPFEKPEIICNQSVPFHPLFNSLTGKLDTTPAFPQWTSNGWIIDLLQYFEQILLLADGTLAWISEYLCNSDTFLDEAGQLLLQCKELYLIRAKKYSIETAKYLYDEPDSAINFKK
jgi:ubiquitin-protein ligase